MTPSPEPVPVVIDQTGLVEGCLQTDSIEPLLGQISLSNPFETHAIEVVWADGVCDAAIVFTFSQGEGGYQLAGKRPSECSDGGEALPVYVRFTQPMPASSVAASLDGTAEPSAGNIECSEPVGRFGAMVTAEPELVKSCTTVDPTGGGRTPNNALEFAVSNPDRELTRVRIEWGGSPCDAAVGFSMARAPGGYALTVGPRPDGRTLGAEIDGQQLCVASRVSHAVELNLAVDVPAGRVTVTTNLRSLVDY